MSRTVPRNDTVSHQAAALAQRPVAVPRPERQAQVIAVTGGKGGVGKTVLAVNLAILAQRAGFRTLLVDFDPGLGNVDVHLRLAPRHTVEDVGMGHCEAKDAITRGPAGLGVMLGKSGSTQMFRREVFDAAHDAVAELRSVYDVIVLDTGAGIGPSVIETIRRADRALAVATPEPAAVTDAYALCKVVHGEGLPLPELILNRVESREQAMRTGSNLAAICRRFLQSAPELAGWLRDDAALARSVLEQRPLSATAPDADGAQTDLDAISARLLSAIPRSTTSSSSAATDRQRDARRLLSTRLVRRTHAAARPG